MKIKITQNHIKLIKKICKKNNIDVHIYNLKSDYFDENGYSIYSSSYIPEYNCINLNKYEINKMYSKNRKLLNDEGYNVKNMFFGTFLHELGHYKTFKNWNGDIDKFASYYENCDNINQTEYDNIYPERLANRYFRRYYKVYLKKEKVS